MRGSWSAEQAQRLASFMGRGRVMRATQRSKVICAFGRAKHPEYFCSARPTSELGYRPGRKSGFVSFRLSGRSDRPDRIRKGRNHAVRPGQNGAHDVVLFHDFLAISGCRSTAYGTSQTKRFFDEERFTARRIRYIVSKQTRGYPDFTQL